MIDRNIFIVFILVSFFIYSVVLEYDLIMNFDKNEWVKGIVDDDKPLTSFVLNDVTWRRCFISSVIVSLFIVLFVKNDWKLKKFSLMLFIIFAILYLLYSFFVYHYFLKMYNKIEDKYRDKVNMF